MEALRPRHSSFRISLFFLIFVLANILLSYFKWSIVVDLWISLLGLLIPLILYGYTRESSTLEVSQNDPLKVPVWLWMVVFGIGLFFRLYHSTDLCAWPTRDEGIASFAALEFFRTGKPFFFSACGEWPPFYGWLQYFYFEWVGPSLNAFWRFPLLLSIATLLAVYTAARQYFSKRISFLIFALACMEFWPVFLGRFSLSYDFILLWQCLTLGVLGWGLKQSNPFREKTGSFLLGLITAGGFYIYPPAWAINAAFVSIVVVVVCMNPRRRRLWFLWTYGFALLLFLTPLMFESYRQGYGNHIRSLWAGSSFFTASHLLFVDLPYITQIFWGNKDNQMLYGPGWGGFLNPISTAFFLLGVFEVWVLRRTGMARALACAFVLFLIPGYFSNGVEMMRVENLIPILLVVMALGAQKLMVSLKSDWKIPIGVLFLISAGLSFYHLAVPFANSATPASPRFEGTRSEESLNAYEVIRNKAQQAGPGLLFLDFLYCPLDQTLYLATFPYNANMNPHLKVSKPTWAGFLTNINYVPYLKRELPGAQWFVVNANTTPWDGQLVLGVFDLNSGNQQLVQHWLKASPIFHEVVETAYRLPVDAAGDKLFEPLMKGYPLVQGDRYLESAFWEAAYFNHCRDKKFPEAYQDLSKVLSRGYPAAHIYNEMGVYFFSEHDLKKARDAFQTAIRLGGDHTGAPDNLKRVNELIESAR